MLGFSMVRSIAAGIATGVLSAPSGELPDGYWEHSVGTAVACSMLAPRVGCNSSDAFSMGLLHDVGSALLHRLDPEAHEMALNHAIVGDTSLIRAEQAAFGISHDVAAGRVFTAWNFPGSSSPRSAAITSRAPGSPVRSRRSSPRARSSPGGSRTRRATNPSTRAPLAAIGIGHEELAPLVDRLLVGAADVRGVGRAGARGLSADPSRPDRESPTRG